ncbi:MAG: hypothetical protein V3S93_01555 [Methyloceanibacter sp.]
MAGMVLLIRRIMRKQQARVEAELRAAEEAMGRQKPDQTVQLELDPATGIYRPRQMR